MQSDGFNSALSPVVYGDIALSIKINTQIHKLYPMPITMVYTACGVKGPLVC